MPQQVNVGLTAYLLEGLPLRTTVDVQWIEWSETADAPLFAGKNEFEDGVNVSFGVEVRVPVSRTLTLYPRAGLRRFDAPWDDADALPSTSDYQLVLDTDDEAFTLFTFGLGLTWLSDESKVRSLDIAGDVGGDAYWRLNRAHMNCLENLPMFATVVLVATVVGIRTGTLDTLAQTYLVARIGQSLAHVSSGSVLAVNVRFTFFLIQVGCLIGFLQTIWNAG